MPAEIRVDGIARRAGDIADEHALFAQDAIDERRLPDVRTADNRNPRLGLFRFLLFRFRLGQPLDHFVEEIADALPVLRGNLHDRLEPELVEIERARLRALVVGLVDRDDDRPPFRADGLGDFEVGRHQPLASIDDEHEDGGIFERAPPVLEHLLLERILALAEHAGRVGQQKRHVAPVGGLLDDIAGRSGRRVHDGPAGAGDAVEKCRFPDIRATDEDDGGELFGSHV